MISISTENLAQLLPVAVQWVAAKEQVALENGIALTTDQAADAAAAGVRRPEAIRIFRVAQIPLPKHPILKAAVDTAGLISPRTAAIAFRYGIFVKSAFVQHREVIVHEMVHTAQYENLGGISPFLEQYLSQCLAVGYHQAPLEAAAAATAARICQTSTPA